LIVKATNGWKLENNCREDNKEREKEKPTRGERNKTQSLTGFFLLPEEKGVAKDDEGANHCGKSKDN
jgi:hypothetical protein